MFSFVIRIGRYTKSLDTTRYICALCKGPLFMVPLTRKDGTPIKPHVRPFAKYVQQNYRLVKQEIEGIKHKDLMIKLGSDFTAKKAAAAAAAAAATAAAAEAGGAAAAEPLRSFLGAYMLSPLLLKEF